MRHQFACAVLLVATPSLCVPGEATSVELSNKTSQIVNEIAVDGCYVNDFLGIPPQPSAQWERYLYLVHHAGSDELVTLTDHDSPVVRCYSFKALANRKDPRIHEILLTRLYDQEIVQTSFGCIVERESVGDVCHSVAVPKCLTEREKAEVDSIVLFYEHAPNKARCKLL